MSTPAINLLATPPLLMEWRRGWAVHPFVGRGMAHWWWRVIHDETPITRGVLFDDYTLCGRQSIETRAVQLLNPGNFPHCLHCAKKARLRSA